MHDHGLGVWDATVDETLPDDSTVSLDKRSLKVSGHSLGSTPRLVTVQVLGADGSIIGGLFVRPADLRVLADEAERRQEAL